MENIESDFEEGIKNNEFKIYIQPKFDTRTEQIVGGEALIRRIRNNQIIMPKFFIPQYEENGIITRLDMFVFENICKKLKEWKENNYKLLSISINQSARDLYDKNYLNKLKQVIDKYGINPNLIELELTETVVIDNIENAKEAEKEVHSLGFIVSMDDFGVGYSSFSMLRKIEIDVLKIDKTFSDEVLKDERGKIIIESIIEMAKKLKIKTVAEGIETIEQVEYLKQIGCDIIQGYFFDKPLPIEQFEEKYIKELYN